MLSLIWGGVMLLYLGGGVRFLAAGLWAAPPLDRGARGLLGAGLAAHSAALLGRWWESYHLALGHAPLTDFFAKLRLVILQAPLANFYESLVFFAWCLPFLAFLAFRRYLRDGPPLFGARKAAPAIAPAPAAVGPAPLPGHHHRLFASDPGDFDRRGLGRNGLGPVLELGPQGDLVFDHLADLRHPAPRPPGEGLAGAAHRLAGGDGLPGRALHLLRGELSAAGAAFLPDVVFSRKDAKAQRRKTKYSGHGQSCAPKFYTQPDRLKMPYA